MWEKSRRGLVPIWWEWGNVATLNRTLSGRQHVVVAAARDAGDGQTWPDNDIPRTCHRRGHGQTTGTYTYRKRLCCRVLV